MWKYRILNDIVIALWIFVKQILWNLMSLNSNTNKKESVKIYPYKRQFTLVLFYDLQFWFPPSGTSIFYIDKRIRSFLLENVDWHMTLKSREIHIKCFFIWKFLNILLLFQNMCINKDVYVYKTPVIIIPSCLFENIGLFYKILKYDNF